MKSRDLTLMGALVGAFDMPAVDSRTSIDVLVPFLEIIREEGAFVILKLDGERGKGDAPPYTGVVRSGKLGERNFHTDTGSLVEAAAHIIVNYAEECWGFRPKVDAKALSFDMPADQRERLMAAMTSPCTRERDLFSMRDLAAGLGMPAIDEMTGLDALVPYFEIMREEGAVVVLVLDGDPAKRSGLPYMALLSRGKLGEKHLRSDAGSLVEAAAHVLVDYARACWGFQQAPSQGKGP